VDSETLEAIVFRMHQQGVKDYEERRRRIRQKYLSQYDVKTKSLGSKTEEAAIVQRLYDTTEKDRARSKELFEKFNPPRNFLKRTKEELEANDKRLFSGGFAKKH
jgi:hypothetical protein